MRITGGIHRGRLLQSPKDRSIRPTSDKVRQAVFNMLNARALVDGALVLDAFCGTGALGLEALSQGALCCTFIDKNRESLGLAKDNFAALKIDAKHSFILKDATKAGAKPDSINPSNLVFLDPPYHQGLVLESLKSLDGHGWVADGAAILIEAENTLDMGVISALGYDILLVRDYGDTRIGLAHKTGGV